MERRTLATLQAQWPEPGVAVSSPPVSFREYLTPELPRELVVSAMVGDFQRILEYPRQGFSTEQPVTPEAMQAFRTLVEAGYDSQLLKGFPSPGILEKTRFLLSLAADCGHQYNPHSQPNLYILSWQTEPIQIPPEWRKS